MPVLTLTFDTGDIFVRKTEILIGIWLTNLYITLPDKVNMLIP